ncbi:MAG: ABC transporter permease, partial [Planctomycetaceae bacterium]
AVPGITEYRWRITFPVVVDIDGFDRPVSGQVVSLPDAPSPVVNNIVLRSGGYFTEARREEVIVNDAFARAHRIRPGDRLRIIHNNRKQELVVVGTAISSEFVYLIAPGGIVPDPQTYGVFYLKESCAEEVSDFDGACNQIVGLLDERFRERPEEILRDVETRLGPFGVFTTTPRSRQPSHWFLKSELDGLRVSVIVLPIIFLGVAALILNILMLRLAEQQRTVVGTLKALGYGNAALFAHYLKFGGTVGLIGGVLGAAAGFALAEGMTGIYSGFYEFPRLVNRPALDVILLGVGIGVLFAVAGTLRGIRAILKLAPSEAMRPSPPKRGRRILLERWGFLWKRLGFRWQMVLRGIFRQRLRTIVTVGTAAVGAALLLVTLHMRDAMFAMIDFQYEKVLKADFELSFASQQNYGALYESRRLPGVESAEPLFHVGCTFHNGHVRKQGGITGVIRDARLTGLFDTAGNRVTVPNVGVVLTRKLAETLHVRAGDTLVIVPVQGLRERIRVPVASVVDSYLGTGAYAEFHYLNRLVGETAAVNAVQLLVKPGPDETRAFYREVKRLPTVQAFNAIRDEKDKLTGVLVDQMMIGIVVVILFAGTIFCGSILNSSLISLTERQNEVALMRVLGYGPRDVGSLFWRENLCLNTTGTLLGLPLGYWLSWLIDNLYDTELFRIPFVIEPQSWALTLLLGFVFAAVSHWPVQRAVNRMNWLAAINVKE